MPRHRLTWQGGGALDLSQVLDVRGIPVLFTKPGDSVVVDDGTCQHPLVKRYIGAGLHAVPLDVAPVTSPTPAPKAPLAPVTRPSPPAQPTAVSVELKDEVKASESVNVFSSAKDEDASPATVDAEDTADESDDKTDSSTKKRSG